MPAGSYARASHVVHFCFAAVMMASLPIAATGADVLPMAQQHACYASTGADWLPIAQQQACDVAEERLPLDGMTNGLPIKMLATFLFLLLSVHGPLDDSLVFEEGQQRPQNPIDGGTRTSSTFFTGLGTVQLWTRSVPWVLELHVRWERHTWNWIGSMSDMKKLARQIGDRSGVPKAFWTRHWMRWWISVRCMDSIHHMALLARDPWIPHIGQLATDLRSSCLQCLLHFVTTLMWHPWKDMTTLARLWKKTAGSSFEDMGPWELYAHHHSLRAGNFSLFLFTLFAPVLIALHAPIQPWACEFYHGLLTAVSSQVGGH